MERIRFLNPTTDEGFARTVKSIIADGVGSPTALQHRLRSRYPFAVVRERGLAGEGGPAWYVYRDGHWTPESGDDDAPEHRARQGYMRTTAGTVRADAIQAGRGRGAASG